MLSLSAAEILSLWERGAQRHPLDRALLLLGSARRDESLSALADVPVGQRDQTLIALRRAMFGRHLPGRVDCPACGEPLEFTLDADALTAPAGPARIQVDDLTVRLPTTRDLASIIASGDRERAPFLLAQRCCESADSTPPLTAEQVEKIGAALEAADPSSDIVLDFRCEACGFVWQTGFDAPSYLWSEIEERARKLLTDVHTLASAYGWNEQQVLGLGETRRAAYIDMVLA